MPPKTPERKMRVDRALVLILALYAALALAYSFATKLKYGPDEPAHFIYIRSIAENLSPPPISHEVTPTEDSISSHEGHQPPLYYAMMATPYAALHAIGASTETIWRVLRLLTIPLALVWIYLVHVLAARFFRTRSHALATTALVAFIPTSAYMAGLINNDILAALLFTWALVLMIDRLSAGGATSRSAIVLGIVIGLAALSKAQGLVLIPALFVGSYLVWRRNGRTGGGAEFGSVVLTLAAAAVVCGWWFIRCWLVHGSPMPQSLSNPVIEPDMLAFAFITPQGWHAISVSALGLYGHFWVPFWLVCGRIGFLPYIGTVCAVTLVMGAGFVARVRRNGDPDKLSLGFLIFTGALTFLLWVRYVIIVDKLANMQGRLLLPVASVAGIVFVLGADGWLRSARAKAVGAALGLGLMLLLNVGVIACAVELYH